MIPQVKRIDRLNPDQLRKHLCKGPSDQLVPLSTFATLQEETQPRSLNRFQQLNAVKLSGVAIRPLDEALRFLESESAKILPQGYKWITRANPANCASKAASSCRRFALALMLIFLVLAAQFNSFRDPLIILLGSVPLAMFGALLFCFLKMPDPNIPFSPTAGPPR